MKTLVIDAQIWQTNAWYRGMGVYTRRLVATLIESNSQTINVVLLLNKNIPTDIERITAIKSELPSADIRQLDLPVDPEPKDTKKAVAQITAFFSEFSNDEPVYYFVPALFLFNYAAVFPENENVKKIVLFYDLIPLLYWEHFAQFFPPHLYFPRFRLVFEADVVFTISETTAKDLANLLSLPNEKMVNLDGSVNNPSESTPKEAGSTSVVERLGLQGKRFFLMPTGGLPHKNNIRAAQAFRQLRDVLGMRTLRLVATSFFDELEREELRLILGDDIVFTGNVTDQEIEQLYTQCDVVLFPSFYEGLGIPVLEGVINNKPVACSDISVFREIPYHNEALYMFDPYDISSIADAMFSAMAQAGFADKRQKYAAILKKYSWQRSAGIFAQALDNIPVRKAPARRKKVAITCPDPRKNADVAILAQRLYGYGLMVGVEFVYFIDPGNEDGCGQQFLPDYIRYIAACYDISDFYAELEKQQFASVVHLLSDDPQFYALLRAALKVEGYILISSETYLPVFQKMENEGLINRSQRDAEEKAATLARDKKLFESLSLLVGRPGILLAPNVKSGVVAALKTVGAKTKVLEMPEYDKLAVFPKEPYQQFIEFVVGERAS